MACSGLCLSQLWMCRRVEKTQYRVYARHADPKIKDLAIVSAVVPEVAVALSESHLHQFDVLSGSHVHSVALPPGSRTSGLFACGSAVLVADVDGTLRYVLFSILMHCMQCIEWSQDFYHLSVLLVSAACL
jgi:hypothetical protein